MNRRDALRQFGTAAALGAVSGAMIATIPGCPPTPPPASAETIGAELTAAIERYREALVVEHAALDARRPFEWAEFDRAEPSADARAAFVSADETFQAAAEVTFEAIDAIVAVPIHTLADMRAKAVFLSTVMPPRCLEYNEALAALLASMSGEFITVLDLPAEPDPLLAVIGDYRRNMAVFNASGEMTSDEDDALAAATWRPHYNALRTGQPAATSLTGAVAALRLAAEDMEGCQDTELVGGLVRAALAYFDGRA